MKRKTFFKVLLGCIMAPTLLAKIMPKDKIESPFPIFLRHMKIKKVNPNPEWTRKDLFPHWTNIAKQIDIDYTKIDGRVMFKDGIFRTQNDYMKKAIEQSKMFRRTNDREKRT